MIHCFSPFEMPLILVDFDRMHIRSTPGSDDHVSLHMVSQLIAFFSMLRVESASVSENCYKYGVLTSGEQPKHVSRAVCVAVIIYSFVWM